MEKGMLRHEFIDIIFYTAYEKYSKSKLQLNTLTAFKTFFSEDGFVKTSKSFVGPFAWRALNLYTQEMGYLFKKYNNVCLFLIKKTRH